MSTQDPGESLLHAAEYGNVDHARTLLSDDNADPDAKDASESTPLHYAAKKRDLEMVELLLEYGADPNAKGASESTPLHHAAEERDPEVVELLLGYGADPNAKGASGSTSLHYAAEHGHDVMVQQLLDYCADANAQNDSGSTPLHIAVKGENDLVVKLLLDSRADPDAQDKEGNTPWHFTTKLNIVRLLKREAVALPQQAQDVPKFPITINGNTLDQSRAPAAESLKTKYILVQSRTRLSPSDRTELDRVGVKHLDYVSKNTYLCQYRGVDLGNIRKLELVVYVDIYRNELKITPRLKEAEQDQIYKIDVVFHESVDTSSPDLQRDIAVESHCSMEGIKFLPNMVRLTMQCLYLEAVASIDDVRCIERVGKVVMHNDAARRILQLESNLQPSTGPIQQQAYKGSRQVIAVADSGLDQGENMPLHAAFVNGVRRWYSEHGPTDDRDGHGTHACGSAVGDGTANGHRIMGTAPQANLIVQSIWDPATRGFVPPPDLTDLFSPPYLEEARVHSNSWGEGRDEKDKQGNPIQFEQIEYTRHATQIDKFVYEQPDMVICFSAGNNGRKTITRSSDKGHIGAEAAAKNCITVGASRSTKDRNAPNADAVADFSNRGPVKPAIPRSGGRRRGHFKPDRYKPDVVAPGTSILSANSSVAQNPPQNFPDRAWCFMDGTSMATPLVAGCAAVLREALTSRYPTSPPFPTAALIKALLINGAVVLRRTLRTTSGFIPSPDSGFGRVNMANAIKIVHGELGTGFREGEVSQGTRSWDEKIDVKPGYTTLKATLVWSDPSGEEIKNELRLQVNDGNERKYALTNNTVQQVVWNEVPDGVVTLTVGVIARLDKSPQPFALVWRLY